MAQIGPQCPSGPHRSHSSLGQSANRQLSASSARNASFAGIQLAPAMWSCWQAFCRAQLTQPGNRMPIPVSQPVPPDSTDPAMPAAPAPAPATVIPVPPAIPAHPAPAVPAPWPDYSILAQLQATGYQVSSMGNQIVLSPVANQSGYQRTPPPAPGSGFPGDSPARSWGWNQQGQPGQQWQGPQGNWQAQQSPEPPHQNTWGPQSSTWGAQQGAGSHPALPAGWNHQQPSDRQRRDQVRDELIQILNRFGDGLPEGMRSQPATTNPVVVVNQGHQQGSTTGRRTRTPSPVNTGASDDPSKEVTAPSEDDAAGWWAYQVKGTGMRMM